MVRAKWEPYAYLLAPCTSKKSNQGGTIMLELSFIVDMVVGLIYKEGWGGYYAKTAASQIQQPSPLRTGRAPRDDH